MLYFAYQTSQDLRNTQGPRYHACFPCIVGLIPINEGASVAATTFNVTPLQAIPKATD